MSLIKSTSMSLRDPCGRSQYFGPSTVCFSRSVSTVMGIATRSKESGPLRFAGNNGSSMRFHSPSFPGNLSQTYFENIHPQYPILHKPTFQKWEDHYMRANMEGGQTLVDESSLFFVLMVRAFLTYSFKQIAKSVPLLPAGTCHWSTGSKPLRYCYGESIALIETVLD